MEAKLSALQSRFIYRKAVLGTVRFPFGKVTGFQMELDSGHKLCLSGWVVVTALVGSPVMIAHMTKELYKRYFRVCFDLVPALVARNGLFLPM